MWLSYKTWWTRCAHADIDCIACVYVCMYISQANHRCSAQQQCGWATRLGEPGAHVLILTALHVCMYVCMYICIYIYIYIYILAKEIIDAARNNNVAELQDLVNQVRTFYCVYMCMFMYVCIHMYIYICICKCICIYIHAYVYKYIYTYIYIYVLYWMYNIYIYTYIKAFYALACYGVYIHTYTSVYIYITTYYINVNKS